MLNPSEDRPLDAIPLQGILESLVDGILVLTHKGKEVYCNDLARQICQKLNSHQSDQRLIPAEIWQACETVLDSCSLYPEKAAITEFEMSLEKDTKFRVRIRWIPLNNAGDPGLLVILEDRQASLRHRAISEARQYQLTSRQAEVWTLRLMGNSYREIATKLYISLETVRRHLRTIYAKRNMILELD